MYSWYWSLLQDWASLLISTTLVHYPRRPRPPPTHTHFLLSEITSWNRSFAWTNPPSKLVAGIRRCDVAASSQPAKWWWCLLPLNRVPLWHWSCHCDVTQEPHGHNEGSTISLLQKSYDTTDRSDQPINSQMTDLRVCRLQTVINPDCLLHHWKVSTGSCSKMMNAKYKKGPSAQVSWCKPNCNPHCSPLPG